MAENKPGSPNPYKPNIWGFLSNVVQNATNKGQLLPLGIITFCIIFIIRIPGESIEKIGEKIIEAFDSWHKLGWVIMLLETIIGVFIFKRQTKKYEEEIERIEEQKNKLQDKILGKDPNHKKNK